MTEPSPAQPSPLGVFERWLTLWVALAMIAGLALGALAPGAVQAIAAIFLIALVGMVIGRPFVREYARASVTDDVARSEVAERMDTRGDRHPVDVDETFQRLLEQEDTDGDMQISISDRGPKSITLKTVKGTTAEVREGHVVGIIGLGLSEAAYMAEIARAGILSVDNGQREAAQALGMSNGKAMRRIILQQAMRVIVPPTGNEAISMVKDTSLLTAVPVTAELFNQAQNVANNTYKVMPSYVGALMWYLILCTLLMLLQSWLERRFARGFGAQGTTTGGFRSRLSSIGSDH